MAVITVFDRGNLKELDTARKSCPEPEPGLVASFSSPVSALIAGVMFFILGVFSTICVFVGGVQHLAKGLILGLRPHVRRVGRGACPEGHRRGGKDRSSAPLFLL
jgi:hypothetical protein